MDNNEQTFYSILMMCYLLAGLMHAPASDSAADTPTLSAVTYGDGLSVAVGGDGLILPLETVRGTVPQIR
ncbi:hypothetical protein SAMN03159341_11359 [Paenibacillus sp. 1_12]|nr:hypothetical protein SAMN03159341_11359 [Paenibacillus sp. 1_12]